MTIRELFIDYSEDIKINRRIILDLSLVDTLDTIYPYYFLRIPINILLSYRVSFIFCDSNCVHEKIILAEITLSERYIYHEGL